MTRWIVAQEAPLQINADVYFSLPFLTPARSRAVIAYCYPSLKLANELATIAFHFDHQQEVEAGGRQRQQQAQ